MIFLSFISMVSSGAQVLLPHTAGPPMGSMPSPEPQVRNSFTLTFLGTRLSDRNAPMRPSSAVSRVSPEMHHHSLQAEVSSVSTTLHTSPWTQAGVSCRNSDPGEGREPQSFIANVTCRQDGKMSRLTGQDRALRGHIQN